jgi:hypothetical protein
MTVELSEVMRVVHRVATTLLQIFHQAMSLASLQRIARPQRKVMPMFTAEQYRAKAAECMGALDNPRSPSEAKEYRRLEQTYRALADNEEWLVRNADKVAPSSK